MAITEESFEVAVAWKALASVPSLNAHDLAAAAGELGRVDAVYREPAAWARAITQARQQRLGDVSDNPTPPDGFADLVRASERYSDTARAEIQNALDHGIAVHVFGDVEYPVRLAQITDPPFLLFQRGTPRPTRSCIAVVGSRAATAYGHRVTRDIVRELVHADVTVVSGMARGIDSLAHQAALEESGATIAVLGTRIDRPYPRAAAALYRDLLARGGIYSEYGPGAAGHSGQFLARNRIIAGLADAVIVIEAGIPSGTFNTVSHALGYGRPVYAVPGDVGVGRSAGTNRLILQDMAHLLVSADDVLRDLGLARPEQPIASGSSPRPRHWIVEHLRRERCNADALIDLGRGSVGEVLRALGELERDGWIERARDGSYGLVSRV